MKLCLKLIGIEEKLSIRLGQGDHLSPATKRLLNSVVSNFINYFKKSKKVDCADAYIFLGVTFTRTDSTD